jgi:hypothetical protein
MKAIREKITYSDGSDVGLGERYYVFCPGCYEASKDKYPDDQRFWLNGCLHCFSASVHQFDGNLERPTISPSLLCTYTDHETGQNFVCHSFIKDGRIQYLGDCTHVFANQTVDLMDVPQKFIDDMA